MVNYNQKPPKLPQNLLGHNQQNKNNFGTMETLTQTKHQNRYGLPLLTGEQQQSSHAQALNADKDHKTSG